MDVEKVIKSLEICSDVYYGATGACSSCSFSQSKNCFAELVHQTIALLKEQGETIDKLYSILNDVCKDVREETEGDHVCGLCEYDGAYKTDSGDWAGECPGFESADCFCMKNEIRKLCGKELI